MEEEAMIMTPGNRAPPIRQCFGCLKVTTTGKLVDGKKAHGVHISSLTNEQPLSQIQGAAQQHAGKYHGSSEPAMTHIASWVIPLKICLWVWDNYELCKRPNDYQGQCSHGREPVKVFVFRKIFIKAGPLSCRCYYHGIVFVRSNILSKSRNRW